MEIYVFGTVKYYYKVLNIESSLKYRVIHIDEMVELCYMLYNYCMLLIGIYTGECFVDFMNPA